jgi:DNA-binding NarL/FixJ family response regulator
MQGTLYGPVVMPGNSQQSILNMLVEGRADSSMRMPHNRERPLTDREIEVLRLWVDQGANNN